MMLIPGLREKFLSGRLISSLVSFTLHGHTICVDIRQIDTCNFSTHALLCLYGHPFSIYNSMMIDIFLSYTEIIRYSLRRVVNG